MTIGVHASQQGLSGGATAVTAGVTTTGGSTVIAFLCVAAGTALFGATPMQDNKGNTWLQVGSDQTYGTQRTRVYKAVNITGGSGHTFTATPDTGTFVAIMVQEVTGAPASPTVVSASAEDTTSPYASPSVSPGGAGTLVGGIWTDAPSGTETDTWGGSFASGDKTEELANANTGITGSLAAADKAAGTYNGSVTVAGVTVTDTAVWAVFVQTSSSDVTTALGGSAITPGTGTVVPGISVAL